MSLGVIALHGISCCQYKVVRMYSLESKVDIRSASSCTDTIDFLVLRTESLCGMYGWVGRAGGLSAGVER